MTLMRACSARRRCSSHSGKYGPLRSLGMASSMVPARGVPFAFAVAVAVVGPLGAALAVGGVAEAVRLGWHQRLGHGLHHGSRQIGILGLDLLCKPGGGVQAVAGGHRLSSFDLDRESRRIYAMAASCVRRRSCHLVKLLHHFRGRS